MATMHAEEGLDVEDAWPPYKEMPKWLDEDKDPEADPSLDLVAPDVNHHSLMDSRYAAPGKEQAA